MMTRRRKKLDEKYLVSPEEMISLFNKNLTQWDKKFPHRLWASQSYCARLGSLDGLLGEHWSPKSGNLSFYAKSGVAMEDEINRIFGRAGIFVATDFKLSDELMEDTLNVGGKIDCVFRIGDSDFGILEIKTIASVEPKTRINLSRSHINALLDGNDIVLNSSDDKIIKQLSRSYPKLSHKAQLETYAAITGVNTAFVTLFSRNVVDVWDQNSVNNPSIDFHPIDISDDNLSKRVGSLLYAQRCIDNGLVAEMPYQMSEGNCNFCEHKNYCWNNGQYDIPMIDHEQSVAWKKEAYQEAQEYVSNRPQRYEMFKEIVYEYESKKGN